jgi:hypothetical protein
VSSPSRAMWATRRMARERAFERRSETQRLSGRLAAIAAAVMARFGECSVRAASELQPLPSMPNGPRSGLVGAERP